MEKTPRRKRGRSSGADEDADDESAGRNVQSIEFKADQWEAVSKCAIEDGTPAGTWIRAQALRTARERGYWQPFGAPGDKKN